MIRWSGHGISLKSISSTTQAIEAFAAYHSRSRYFVSLLLEDAVAEPSSPHYHGYHYYYHFFGVCVPFLCRCDLPEGLGGRAELEILSLLGVVGDC